MPPSEPAQLVRDLQRNATDGAALLARRAVSMLRDFVAHAEAGEQLPTVTRACVDALSNARPEMAALGNLVRYWAASFSWPRHDFRACAVAHCDAVLARADRALAETISVARERLDRLPAGSAILTHSASSTVRRTLVDVAADILVTASEPGGEGRRLATDLGVVCIADQDAVGAVADVAAVVVGADAISADAFVNKVGTRRIGEAARRAGTPFFVIAESYKWLPHSQPLVVGGVFERVPYELVTAFLSDRTRQVTLFDWPRTSM